MKITDSVSKFQFTNYNMEHDDLDVVDEMSRMGVLVHNSLQYKRRRDFGDYGGFYSLASV